MLANLPQVRRAMHRRSPSRKNAPKPTPRFPVKPSRRVYQQPQAPGDPTAVTVCRVARVLRRDRGSSRRGDALILRDRRQHGAPPREVRLHSPCRLPCRDASAEPGQVTTRILLAAASVASCPAIAETHAFTHTLGTVQVRAANSATTIAPINFQLAGCGFEPFRDEHQLDGRLQHRLGRVAEASAARDHVLRMQAAAAHQV